MLGGRLCDVYDAKRVFIGALVLFGLASLAGGFASDPALIFIARGAQGLAGAVLAPGSIVLVTREFDEGEDRNRALGIFGTVGALGFVLGVIIGGLLTGFAGWRWVFFVNVPIIAVMVAGSAALLHTEPAGPTRPRLDIGGAVVGTASVIALVAGVATSSTAPVRAAAFVAAAVGLFGVFVWVERAAAEPLVPFSVFRSRELSGMFLVAGLTYIALQAIVFNNTLILQRFFGLSPQGAGLALVPGGLAAMAAGSLAPLAVRRIGLRGAALAGVGLTAAGCAVILGPGLHVSPFWTAASGVLTGAIIFTLVTANIGATSAIARERMGLAVGLLNTIQFVCGAIGTALAGVIDVAGTSSAYGATVVMSAAALALAAVGAVVFLRPKPSAFA
jgi:predicted MFS family arabinose efflux permease